MNNYGEIVITDMHIFTIYNWIDHLENIYEDVRASEMDDELAETIHRMVGRLTNELGARILMEMRP